MGAVIDRDQVLHVAKLARLELSDDEVEQMASELSGILEHVDRISELDLEGVEPTSHVVELENVLRADEPRPAWSATPLSRTPLTPPTAPSASRRPALRERLGDPRADSRAGARAHRGG